MMGAQGGAEKGGLASFGNAISVLVSRTIPLQGHVVQSLCCVQRRLHPPDYRQALPWTPTVDTCPPLTLGTEGERWASPLSLIRRPTAE